jgi:hypothetical protein
MRLNMLLDIDVGMVAVLVQPEQGFLGSSAHLETRWCA